MGPAMNGWHLGCLTLIAAPRVWSLEWSASLSTHAVYGFAWSMVSMVSTGLRKGEATEEWVSPSSGALSIAMQFVGTRTPWCDSKSLVLLPCPQATFLDHSTQPLTGRQARLLLHPT